jgi:hypothetical protein
MTTKENPNISKVGKFKIGEIQESGNSKSVKFRKSVKSRNREIGEIPEFGKSVKIRKSAKCARAESTGGALLINILIGEIFEKTRFFQTPNSRFPKIGEILVFA